MGGLVANAAIWIDPGAIAFDARDDREVAGTSVTLVDVTSGAPAQVFARDGVTPAPATIVTGALGVFEFALVRAGTYRFDVVPAPGYRFPSTVAPAQLPAGRMVDALGSYGGAFVVADSLAPVEVDVPLDAEAGTCCSSRRRRRPVRRTRRCARLRGQGREPRRHPARLGRGRPRPPAHGLRLRPRQRARERRGPRRPAGGGGPS
jgi:hypothetical protein